MTRHNDEDELGDQVCDEVNHEGEVDHEHEMGDEDEVNHNDKVDREVGVRKIFLFKV